MAASTTAASMAASVATSATAAQRRPRVVIGCCLSPSPGTRSRIEETRGSARPGARLRPRRGSHLLRSVLVEQLGELLGHRAAELLGIDDGDGSAIVARHVVADADRNQLDRRAQLDLLDHPAQVALEI